MSIVLACVLRCVSDVCQLCCIQLAEDDQGQASAEPLNPAQAATAAMPPPALEEAPDTQMMEVDDTLVLPDNMAVPEKSEATKPEPVLQGSTADAVATKVQEPVLQVSTSTLTAAAVATKPQEPVLQVSTTTAAVATKPQEPVPLQESTAAAVATKPHEPAPQESTAAAVATKPQEPVPLQESTAAAVATKPQEPVQESTAAAVATKPQEPVPQESTSPAAAVATGSQQPTANAVAPKLQEPVPQESKPARVFAVEDTCGLITVPGMGQVSADALRWLMNMMPVQNGKDGATANSSAAEQALKRPNTVDFEQLLKGMKQQPSSQSQPGISAPSTPSSLLTAGTGQNTADEDKNGKEMDAALELLQNSAPPARTQEAPCAPASSRTKKPTIDDEDDDLVEDYAQGSLCVYKYLHVHAYDIRCVCV